jgi:putative endonuclease
MLSSSRANARDLIETAIQREKEVEKWRREKKETLISTKNKEWRFLNEEIKNEMY